MSPNLAMAAGATALAIGGVAAGLKLERELVGRRLREVPADVAEPFFALRSDGPAVQTSDGVRLHVEVDEADPTESDGGLPTLVFVHGYALGLDCWHFQRQHFRGRFRMIFYDQRSHGRSGRSAPELCRIPRLAEDLAQILREVADRGPVILIGHSMGGMTILELAREHPEWFGGCGAGVGPIIGVGLICTSADGLLDPHPVRGLPGRVASSLVEPTVAVLNRIPTVLEQTRQADTDLAYLITRQLSFPSSVPAGYVAFIQQMFSVTPMDVLADFYPAFLDLDQSEGLEVVNRVPTAVVGAAQDLVLPLRHTEAILDRLPDAEQLILDPSGHLAMIEHHDAVNAELDALVNRAAT
jgi:pimeloyl-ACP methyl ester carboxylesterase